MAGSAVTQDLEIMRDYFTDKVIGAVLTFSWTADDTDGSVPTASISDTFLDKIRGMYITEGRTNPGSTAPTDNYDITITDEDGIDIMGGSLTNRDEANSEAVAPAIATGLYWPRIITDNITFTLANNSVNSATGTCKLMLER